jgi:hypothetical protein
MIQRRGSPSFSHEDEERLLAFMSVTRELSIRYGSAYGFHSKQNELHTALNTAIDKLGEHITGDPQLFLPPHATAGARQANPEGNRAKQVRELLWRELRIKYR